MIPELHKLVKLQEIDQELHRLADEIRRFEPILAGAKKERDRRAATKGKREAEMTSLATRRRVLEKELQTTEDKLPKLLKQQEQVRTAREAEALEQEISTVQAAVSALEGQILDLLEQEENLAAEHQKAATREMIIDREASVEEKRLLGLRKDRLELAESLRGDRNAAANQLGDLKEDYDWVLKKHGPSIVVPLDKGGCSGCGSMLVPHMALNVVQDKELTRCPSCHRFLRKPGEMD